MKIMKTLLTIALIGLTACGSQRKPGGPSQNMAGVPDSLRIIVPKYAQGFQVSYPQKGLVLLEIQDPANHEKENFHFALVSSDFSGPVPEGYTQITTPIHSAICMTSLQLSNFIKLGLTEKVVGITSTRHLHNPLMNQQLRNGQTQKIGIEGNFDNEIIMAINPDVILISPFKRGGYDAIRQVDIPLVPHLGYKELTPLGQAEWLKVVGLLTGEEAQANEIFTGIEKRYNELKALTESVKHRPSVFSGEMRGGNWYAVGGKSFLAQIFRDAGADYFLKDNEESGGVTLNYETVYTNAAHADYWRIVNSFEGEFGYDALEAQDKRYTDFKAWKDHGVVYCNMKQVPFYEAMPVEPEIVLADFIHVFHPELLREHTPKYYHLLP